MRVLCLVLCSLALVVAAGGAHAEDNAPLARYPSLSPDGKELAFTYQGDIWKVATGGGVARRLTDHVAYEAYPKFSPDGRWIAFASARWGNYDIYVIPSDGGKARRLTFHHYADYPECWSPDSKHIYFHAGHYGSYDLYRVGLEGGTPVRLTNTYRQREYYCCVSPDGSRVAFCLNGHGGGYYRKIYHGSLQSDIWTARLGNPISDFVQVTSSDFFEFWPLWSADGKSLYYVSHESGCPNLCRISLKTGKTERLTDYNTTGVYFPTISADGGTIVFEHDFYLYSYKPGGRPRRIEIQAIPDTKYNQISIEKVTSGLREYRLSPDGKKIAFVLRGEVWVMPAEEGSEARRLTQTRGEHWALDWAPDSQRLSYTRRTGDNIDTLVNVIPEKREYPLSATKKQKGGARWSPDGESIIYCVDDKELWITDPEGKEHRKLVSGWFRRQTLSSRETYNFSPDSQWLAYRDLDKDLRSHIYVVPVAGGKKHRVSDFPSCTLPRWSSDGKLLYFLAVEFDNYSIYKVPLEAEEIEFNEDKLDKLFEKKKKKEPEKPEPGEKEKESPGEPEKAGQDGKEPAGKPGKKVPEVKIDFTDIEKRVERVTPTDSSETAPLLTPDGKTWVFVSDIYKGKQIWTLPTKKGKSAKLRQLTSSQSSKRNLQLDPKGKSVYFESDGRVYTLNLDSGKSKSIPFTCELKYDQRKRWRHVFDQAHWIIKIGFYDEKLHGVDWEAVRERYEKVLPRISTAAQFDSLMWFMLGELNASHIGYSTKRRDKYPVSVATGWLGVDFDQQELEAGRFKIIHVLKGTPASNPHSKLEVGEYILKVNSTELHPGVNFYSLLEGKVGKRIALTVARDHESDKSRVVRIKPVSNRDISRARFNEWVESRRELVRELSGGLLGYLHIRSMGRSTLDKFSRELYSQGAGKLGLVIDVRYNTGGWSSVLMLDILSQKEPWLMRKPRTYKKAVSETFLRSQGYEKPTIALINERSFSNAEVFAEGYRRLKLGTLVGVATPGRCIGTGSVKLIDGSSLALPGTGAWTVDGENLDFRGRQPDVHVINTPKDAVKGKDVQLRTAVKLLMGQILKRRRSGK